jgi:hypothetical protein
VEKLDYLEDLGVDESIILKWILSKSVGRAWTGLMWFRIGESSWFHKMWGIA